MPVMETLRMFVAQEPVVAASCLIAGVDVENVRSSRTCCRCFVPYCRRGFAGLFLPAVVRPILDSFESAKQVPQPALSDVVAAMTGKKQD